MSNLRPDWDFQYANGPESSARTGSSPGCTNQSGDGGFDNGTTGCNKQCPGCGGDWCCDCSGCRPGKCDDVPANSWCQDYWETWGKVAGGCPPPNDDPCYTIDPLTQRWVPNTDACFCPGATRVRGSVCNPNTGDWDDPVVYGNPSEPKNETEDPLDEGPRNDPNLPTTTVCYLKSVEVFGDYDWHQLPCHCRVLGSADAIRRCINGTQNTSGIRGCDCTIYTTEGNVIAVRCQETINSIPTGDECDPVECNCNNDCNPGQTCNNFGECV